MKRKWKLRIFCSTTFSFSVGGKMVILDGRRMWVNTVTGLLKPEAMLHVNVLISAQKYSILTIG